VGSPFFSVRPRIAAGNYEHLTSFNNLYQPCEICGKFHFSASIDKKYQDKINKRADKLAKDIYTGKFKGDIDPELTTLVAGKLKDAVIQGYGASLPEVAYNSPDWNMIANLDKNVYQFAAAKNYQNLKDITTALKDNDGNIRSFKEFREAAGKISYQYNTDWLNTEYNTAIGCGQMAGRWVDFQKNADSMPYLQYVTAGDDRVREEHAVLDGVIKRIDDPFWDIYYPPNGYNCRCDVIQLPGDAQETDTEEINKPVINTLFRTNTAKHGLIFPEKHPYFKGIPDDVKKASDTLSRTTVRAWTQLHGEEKAYNKVMDADINIEWQGIKKATDQPHDNYYAKNIAIYKIDRLITGAKEHTIVPDTEDRILNYHYLKINIAGKDSWIVIKERKDNSYHLYSIVDKIKKE